MRHSWRIWLVRSARNPKVVSSNTTPLRGVFQVQFFSVFAGNPEVVDSSPGHVDFSTY